MKLTAHSSFTLLILSLFLPSILLSCKGKGDKAFDSVPDQFSQTGSTSTRIHTSSNNPTFTAVKDAPFMPVSDDPSRIPVRNIGRLPEIFNDSNRTQMQYARALGISPIYNIEDAYNTRRPVIKISTTDLYQVDTLTHSLPFLVPEAADLLSTIGKNFIDSLKSRGAGGYKIKVTSMLRTPHTVKKLRKVNINATDSSTHQFGTTFDISYTKFQRTDSPVELHDGDLKNLLAEVLLDLRNSGRCLVKFERKTSCFHVTATR